MNPSSQEFLVQKRSCCSHNFREFHPELYDPQCLGNSWEVLTEFQGIEEQRGCLIWWLDAIFLYETIKISFVLACNLVDVKPSHFPFSYSISIRKLQCQLKRLHLHILWVIFPFSHFPFYYVPPYLTRYSFLLISWKIEQKKNRSLHSLTKKTEHTPSSQTIFY